MKYDLDISTKDQKYILNIAVGVQISYKNTSVFLFNLWCVLSEYNTRFHNTSKAGSGSPMIKYAIKLWV